MGYKHFIFKNYSKVSTVVALILCAILLLVVRIKITQNLFLLFLGWNLILAYIPMGIALFLYKYPQLFAKLWFRLLCTLGWILFFPNAPYVITDFIHLKHSHGAWILLDFSVLFLFASSALLLGLYSMQLLYHFYRIRYGPRILDILLIKVCLLSGYGVYLGRVVRLNSWDAFTRPGYTVVEVMQNVVSPLAIGYSLVFGTLLFICHKYLLKRAPLTL